MDAIPSTLVVPDEGHTRLTLFLSGFFNANSVRGGADSAPPEISKTTQRRDILQTALDRLRRDLQLL